jgi:hypothetical protein
LAKPIAGDGADLSIVVADADDGFSSVAAVLNELCGEVGSAREKDGCEEIQRHALHHCADQTLVRDASQSIETNIAQCRYGAAMHEPIRIAERPGGADQPGEAVTGTAGVRRRLLGEQIPHVWRPSVLDS